VLYREDLEQFIGFFRDACTTVTISDSKNRYDSLDEMQSVIGSKIKDLDIRGESPGLHFLLNQQEYAKGSQTTAIFNELRTEEISEAAYALFLKAQEFLVEHQRPLVRWPLAIIAVVALTFTVFLFNRQ
jgi:hypothetical protein